MMRHSLKSCAQPPEKSHNGVPEALQNFLDDGLSPQRLRAVIDRG